MNEIDLNDQLFYNSFAVILLKGCQYRIMEDDILRVSKIEGFAPGSLIEVEDVLLIGSKNFTLLGRPRVLNARVFLRVEEQTKT